MAEKAIHRGYETCHRPHCELPPETPDSFPLLAENLYPFFASQIPDMVGICWETSNSRVMKKHPRISLDLCASWLTRYQAPQYQQADVVYYDPYYYDPTPLSAGAIAGIVIASVVFLLLALWILWCCCFAVGGRRYRRRRRPVHYHSHSRGRRRSHSYYRTRPRVVETRTVESIPPPRRIYTRR